MLLTGTVLAQLIPLLASPLLTRLYTPTDFGLLALYLAVVNALLTLACLRYEPAIIMASDDADAARLLHLCRRISVITALLFTLLLLLYADPLAALLRSPDLSFWLYLAGAHVLLLALLQISLNWLNRRQQYRLMSRNKVLQSTTTTTAQIGLGLVPTWGVTGLVVGTLAGQFAALWSLQHRIRSDLPVQKDTPGRQKALLYRYRHMPLLNGPNAVVDALRLNGINFMLAHAFSQALLGQFTLAWRIVQAPVSLINSALSQVLFQKMAATPPAELPRLLRRSLGSLALAGALPFALLYATAPSLFPWIFGQEWHTAGDIARVLTPWLYLNFISSPLSGFFLISQRQLPLLLFSVVYALTPLLLIYHHQGNLLDTLGQVSAAMSVLLLIFIAMIGVYSRKPGSA